MTENVFDKAPEPTKIPKKETSAFVEPEGLEGAEVVSSPDGALSFKAVRLSDDTWERLGQPRRGSSRKDRQQCRYQTMEVFSGRPRQLYSYFELLQIRSGEIKR